ncbi:MAG TPA: family 16 glycoside hydrolase, partial [Burkholderiaceae bacterium]|nr:family 16 glycoside hydrolase [Burkholderiaceae bacterium]
MDDAKLREDGYVPLITGNSLDSWKLLPGHKGHWTLKDGVINYDGKATQRTSDKKSLWTKENYGDVQMYAEWRLPAKPQMKPQPIVLFNGDFLLDDSGKRITRPRMDAGDSGILLRGTAK